MIYGFSWQQKHNKQARGAKQVLPAWSIPWLLFLTIQ